MTTKKTAIDWLYSQITFNGLDDPNGQVLEEAKAMEKKQMIDMWMDGNTTFIFNGTAEQYYNETYGK